MTDAIGPQRFLAIGIDGFEHGWFTGGTLTWTSGANAGVTARVVRHAGSEIELAAAPRFAVGPGDTFAVTAGCDKSFATCGAKFGNLLLYEDGAFRIAALHGAPRGWAKQRPRGTIVNPGPKNPLSILVKTRRVQHIEDARTT